MKYYLKATGKTKVERINNDSFRVGRMTVTVSAGQEVPESARISDFIGMPYQKRVDYIQNLMALHMQKCKDEISS